MYVLSKPSMISNSGMIIARVTSRAYERQNVAPCASCYGRDARTRRVMDNGVITIDTISFIYGRRCLLDPQQRYNITANIAIKCIFKYVTLRLSTTCRFRFIFYTGGSASLSSRISFLMILCLKKQSRILLSSILAATNVSVVIL